jgi:VIT1/CCC1 family predicted Fe2+/Mn2+ transporter
VTVREADGEGVVPASIDLDAWERAWAEAPAEARHSLEAPQAPEEAPRGSPGWVTDAVYGANDGLGAVFGIVAGVAGYSHGGIIVLISGLAGTLASALSMGAGAYLAAKAEREVYQVELARAKRRVAADPARAREDLAGAYRARGFTADESRWLAARVAEGGDALTRALVQEERGLADGHLRNPWLSALTAALSTAVGAFVPTLPFFFLDGSTAIAVAAAVSLAAHFAVGVAKSAVVPALRWWVAGAEMTLVGAMEGAVTFAIGLYAAHVLPR